MFLSNSSVKALAGHGGLLFNSFFDNHVLAQLPEVLASTAAINILMRAISLITAYYFPTITSQEYDVLTVYSALIICML